ncbi:MAG: hypothetical protein HEEMFOPI_01586 [Holosporales bacterium]
MLCWVSFYGYHSTVTTQLLPFLNLGKYLPDQLVALTAIWVEYKCHRTHQQSVALQFYQLFDAQTIFSFIIHIRKDSTLFFLIEARKENLMLTYCKNLLLSLNLILSIKLYSFNMDYKVFHMFFIYAL